MAQVKAAQSNRVKAVGSNPSMPSAGSSPKGSARMPAVKGSGRMPALGTTASPKGSGRIPAATAPKASGRMTAAGSGASDKKISRPGMKPPAKGSSPKIDPVFEDLEPKEGDDQFETADGPPVQAGKKSSRRMSAVSSRSGMSSASSSKASRRSVRGEKPGRSERSEREEGKSRGSSSKGGGSNMMLIGGAIAVVVLVLMGMLLAGHSKKAKETKTPAKQEAELTDRTPSGDWAKRAADKLARGDKQGAMNDYSRAAEAAQREGSPQQAQNYQMRAYDIQKFTKLNETH